jgi:hypothetical protein
MKDEPRCWEWGCIDGLSGPMTLLVYMSRERQSR